MKQDREARRMQKEAELAEAAILRDKIKATIRVTPPMWGKWDAVKVRDFKEFHSTATAKTNKTRMNIEELRTISEKMIRFY